MQGQELLPLLNYLLDEAKGQEVQAKKKEN